MMKTKRIGWVFSVAAVLLLVAVLSGCTIDINGPGPAPSWGTVYLRSRSSNVYGWVDIRERGERYREVGYLEPYGELRVPNVRLRVTHDVRIERNGWGEYIYDTIRPTYSGQTFNIYW